MSPLREQKGQKFEVLGFVGLKEPPAKTKKPQLNTLQISRLSEVPQPSVAHVYSHNARLRGGIGGFKEDPAGRDHGADTPARIGRVRGLFNLCCDPEGLHSLHTTQDQLNEQTYPAKQMLDNWRFRL